MEEEISQDKIIQGTSIFAIFSFLLAIFSWSLSFLWNACSSLPADLSGVAALIGIGALIHIKKKRLKGELLAIIGIILGIFGFFVLVTLC